MNLYANICFSANKSEMDTLYEILHFLTGKLAINDYIMEVMLQDGKPVVGLRLWRNDWTDDVIDEIGRKLEFVDLRYEFNGTGNPTMAQLFIEWD